MKACIMCGGVGTRLRPLTFERPKPAIPILNKPSIGHLVEHLAAKGFDEIVATLGYQGEQIEAYLGDGSLFGVSMKYSYEKEKLGTAGSVKNAESYLNDEPFLVVGGDHVLDLNLREFMDFHKEKGNIISIALICIDDPRAYGIVDLNVKYQIKRFAEKPSAGEIFSNLASTGIYACNPEVLDYIPKGKFDFARDLFPKLLKKGVKITGWLARGHWTDIGNPASYREACRWKLEHLPGTEIRGRVDIKNARIKGPLVLSHNVSIGRDSEVVGPVVIGNNTTIGNNVLIGPYTSIGSNCEVGSNSQILSSYIYDGVKIGSNTSISGAIVDNNTIIENNSTIENGAVIGPRVVIKSGATVHSNVLIWPEVEVKPRAVVKRNIFNPKYSTSIGGS
ncbi:MAG: NDP-sugar synthase [Methanocellales archaeon]